MRGSFRADTKLLRPPLSLPLRAQSLNPAFKEEKCVFVNLRRVGNSRKRDIKVWKALPIRKCGSSQARSATFDMSSGTAEVRQALHDWWTLDSQGRMINEMSQVCLTSVGSAQEYPRAVDCMVLSMQAHTDKRESWAFDPATKQIKSSGSGRCLALEKGVKRLMTKDCATASATPSEAYRQQMWALEGCRFPELHGNGICDHSENSALCGYDGGDCCISTCGGSMAGNAAAGTMEIFHDAPHAAMACGMLAHMDTSQCKDPSASSCNPRKQANGFCDADQNTAQCGYDGGDCCASTCSDPATKPGACKYGGGAWTEHGYEPNTSCEEWDAAQSDTSAAGADYAMPATTGDDFCACVHECHPRLEFVAGAGSYGDALSGVCAVSPCGAMGYACLDPSATGAGAPATGGGGAAATLTMLRPTITARSRFARAATVAAALHANPTATADVECRKFQLGGAEDGRTSQREAQSGCCLQGCAHGAADFATGFDEDDEGNTVATGTMCRSYASCVPAASAAMCDAARGDFFCPGIVAPAKASTSDPYAYDLAQTAYTAPLKLTVEVAPVESASALARIAPSVYYRVISIDESGPCSRCCCLCVSCAAVSVLFAHIMNTPPGSSAASPSGGTLEEMGNSSWLGPVAYSRGSPIAIDIVWSGLVRVEAYTEHPLTRDRSPRTSTDFLVVDPTPSDINEKERPAAGSGHTYVRSRIELEGFEPWNEWDDQVDRKFRVAIAAVSKGTIPTMTHANVTVISVNTSGIGFQVSVDARERDAAMALYANEFFACPLGGALYKAGVISIGQQSALATNAQGTYALEMSDGGVEVVDGIVISPLQIALIVLGALAVALLLICLIGCTGVCACAACEKGRAAERKLAQVAKKLKKLKAEQKKRDGELKALRAQREALEESVRRSESKVAQLGSASAEGKRAMRDLQAQEAAAADLDAQLKQIEATATKELQRAQLLQTQEQAHRADMLKQRMERAKRKRKGAAKKGERATLLA